MLLVYQVAPMMCSCEACAYEAGALKPEESPKMSRCEALLGSARCLFERLIQLSPRALHVLVLCPVLVHFLCLHVYVGPNVSGLCCFCHALIIFSPSACPLLSAFYRFCVQDAYKESVCAHCMSSQCALRCVLSFGYKPCLCTRTCRSICLRSLSRGACTIRGSHVCMAVFLALLPCHRRIIHA